MGTPWLPRSGPPRHPGLGPHSRFNSKNNIRQCQPCGADIPQAAATRTSNLTDDVNIDHIGPLLPPAILLEEIPASETLVEDIAHRRKEVSVQLSTALGEI